MELKYVDVHCHVQFEDYESDQTEILERMKENDVGGIVVGVDRASSEKALALAERHEHLWAAVGLHPNRVGFEPFDTDRYRTLANHPKVVGIGECGLDYYRPAEVNDEVKRAQRKARAAHIDLAVDVNKPLIIHARPSKGTQDAYHDLIALLSEKKEEYADRLRGDIHFFVGGVAEAEKLFALGFTVSFTAVITFAHDYDEVIRTAPLGCILSETDAPYVAPASRRRERNDPLAVEEVVARIAEVRGEDPEKVREALLSNARRLFSL